ncbi:MAG TPA: chitobiase/beta-hexosaminidase C-terminal domain-containing protein [Terriglobales bacterium]|nr:chitobiase/beta-hexosaminidase C-terminal domain-containing protein [Terriglobales bacterium]
MKTLACYLRILAALLCVPFPDLSAAVNVTTYHNDNSRTGQNTQETILTPANVNSSQFGKLFSVSVQGWVYAQPLYLSSVNIAGGTHNVLYVATEHDMLYAIDADSGTIYWQVSLIPSGGSTVNSSSDLGCGDLVPEVGITGTPVIDTSTGTIYLVAKSKVNGSLVQYLHAIDVVSAAEKFGGPVLIQASAPGTASDGNGTTVTFSPHFENQRAGLLLENGHVVIGWSSHCDISPWHGWVMSYSASTLAQEAVFNTSPNGSANGVWMSGGGLATDSNGNIFFATGNGTWNGSTDYGDSIVKLGPPSGGKFSVLDYFTPYNQSSLANGDTDVASGGLVLLPNLASGQQLLVQMGKEGKMYVVDRNNMGKYCVNLSPPCNGSDPNIVQEIPGATAGVWGSPAYWNGSVYWGGGSDGGGPDNLKAFSFNANNSGLISTSPTSQSAKAFSFSAPSPTISANGNTNGIVWGLDNSAFGSTCSGGSNCQVLYAYDATNLGNMLYNSSQAANNRDVPGGAVKFATPTVANGKVYVGSQSQVSAYGTISATPTAATPAFSPAPGSYTSGVTVTLSDGTAGATIRCTTDGTTPTSNSAPCTSVSISSTTTLKAIATATGYNPSAVASGTYTITAGGSGINYGSGFTSSTGLTLNGTAKLNGTRLRLTDGGGSEAGSAFVSSPINIQNFTTDFSFQLSSASADGITFTIQGVGATALGPSGGGLGYGPDTPGGTPGIANSVAVKFDIYSNAGEGTDSTGLYTDGASPTTPAVDMTSSGVSLLSGDVFNVHITYNGTTLTMTITDATNSSQTFTTSWAINIPGTVGSNTAYVGFTGGTGGLTAIQEILDWTYVATSQSTAATPSFSPAPGVYNLAQSVTLSDTTTGATIHCTTDGSTPTSGSPVCTTVQVRTTTTINAMAVASGYNNSAVASGTYTINTTGNPYVSYSSGFTSTGLAINGSAKLNGTRLRLTDGGGTEAGSGFYTTPLNVQSFSTDFSFQLTNPNADGMAFVIQNVGTTALGPSGGGLGYGPDTPGGTPGIASSVAVKFDLYSNAGEGTNSTGLYTDGASPTTPATTLGGNVNLHSGDVFNVHITYNGTTLTMTLTDATTPADTFTTSWAVNIPSTVGANTAYVGFTAGTGGETATQDILTWTFTSGAPGTIQYEATTIPVTGSPNARSFAWSGFPDGSGEIADGTAVGAYLNFTVNVPAPGTYDIRAATKKFTTRGIFQLSINGTNAGPSEDEYSSNGNGVFQEYDLGNVTFSSAGNYSFKFTVIGHNASSSGYTVCFDYIKLIAQ